MDNRPIGIMDSGVGGLTVACVLKEKYPNEKFIFIGDTARNPYGNKSPEEVTFFAEEMKAFLAGKQVKMIIAARTVRSICGSLGLSSIFIRSRRI